MKVLSVGFSLSAFGRNELAFLRRIKTANPLHPGYGHVITLLSHFSMRTIFGRHTCFVMPLLAQPLNKGMAHSLPLSWKKRVIREIALGLTYLHDECGIIHADITNISGIALAKEAWIDFAVAEDPTKLSLVEQVTVHGQNMNVPVLANQPLSVPNPGYGGVCIVDFSSGSWKEGRHTGLIQNDATRAPEVILDGSWDTPADIWSFGHIVYELVTGMDLIPFPPLNTANFDDKYMIASIHALLGEYPQEFLGHCTRVAEFFDEQGMLLHTPMVITDTLAERLGPFFPGLAIEESLCLAFLSQLLQIDPSRRAQACDVLGHAWLAGAQGPHETLKYPV
ncbi:kinase-like protein [Calocera cornea HHB12733]|uniref:non-specific serine/threonine protein kinase n=1 Tax=Calocera cornea HHB12733 TaxID=1353952 RepID=A0A166MQ93_9BASI|nr:kinase-like protein [Calocera cornea HHB12733]